MMTGLEFEAWRERMGYTKAGAAEALGITIRHVERLSTMGVIPKRFQLAANYLERDHLIEVSLALVVEKIKEAYVGTCTGNACLGEVGGLPLEPGFPVSEEGSSQKRVH